MKMPTRLALLVILASSSASPLVLNTLAQTTAVKAAPQMLHIDAPYAQKLILEAKVAHSELKKIGLHAIAPGETQYAIIANAIPSKIGKVSSAADLTVITSDSSKVYLHAEEGGFFDLGLPMWDAEKRPIGMIVMEVPYKNAATKDEALSMGSKIRDEIAAKIPSYATLFQPAS
jgi:hypothetical protein